MYQITSEVSPTSRWMRAIAFHCANQGIKKKKRHVLLFMRPNNSSSQHSLSPMLLAPHWPQLPILRHRERLLICPICGPESVQPTKTKSAGISPDAAKGRKRVPPSSRLAFLPNNQDMGCWGKPGIWAALRTMRRVTIKSGKCPYPSRGNRFLPPTYDRL